MQESEEVKKKQFNFANKIRNKNWPKSKLGPMPISKLIPNFITLMGLVIGINSIRFALDDKWEEALYCILASVIIDGIDGRVARLLNASTKFGAELDSLCDFVNFGICPALVIYLWSFQQYELKFLSWFVNSLYIACMAIRLARFNTTAEDANDIVTKKYFTGVPAPAGAILAIFPLILDFTIGRGSPFAEYDFSLQSHTLAIDIYIFIIAMLLPSRLATFSSKNITINPKYLYISMIASAMLIGFTFIYTWQSLAILSIIYIISIPISHYQSSKIS